MEQVLIRNKYARSRVIDIANVAGNEGIRVYRDTPYSIMIQVRTSTPAQGRISHAHVTAAQAREIARHLLAAADELRDDIPPGYTEMIDA